MNELEELKARAAERRRRLEIVTRNSGRRLHATADCDQAEADLDRAIAKAEGWQQAAEATKEVLDKAIPYGIMVREAALLLRDAAKHLETDAHLRGLVGLTAMTEAMAKTEWLEEHRGRVNQ